jgi:hypothetical protein
MSKTLSFALVLSATGNTDRAASLQAAEVALDKYIAERETEQETISQAVHAVFDQYKGAALTMPTIEGMTLRHLNAQPANYKTLGKLVLDFVRANADQKGEAERTRDFGISKGVGGGVRRWCDVPADAPESSDSK